MAVEVILPRVDMDMAEGKIAAWYVKNGEAVRKGQPLFDIETDKATMEVEAEADGVIQGIRGELLVPIPVGQPVAWLLAEGETLTDVPGASSGQPAAAEPGSAVTDANAAPGAAAAPPAGHEAPDRPALLRASPLARSLARERGIDLHSLAGSGPGGRIVAHDLGEKAASPAMAPNESLNLRWLARGDGVPFVLLHGFGTDHASWRPLAAQLDGLPIVAIDLPNHGRSPRQAVRSMADLAQGLLERIDAEGIADCHVAGHSLGGAAALLLGERLGRRLRSLTLLAPAGLGPEINGRFLDGLCGAEDEAALRPWLNELVSEPGWLTASFVATAAQQLRDPDRRAALSAMAAALVPGGVQAESLRPQLQALRVPIKVIWGRADRIIPPQHAQELPGAVALHRLSGVGHLPQLEASALVADLMRHQYRAGSMR